MPAFAASMLLSVTFLKLDLKRYGGGSAGGGVEGEPKGQCVAEVLVGDVAAANDQHAQQQRDGHDAQFAFGGCAWGHRLGGGRWRGEVKVGRWRSRDGGRLVFGHDRFPVAAKQGSHFFGRLQAQRGRVEQRTGAHFEFVQLSQ